MVHILVFQVCIKEIKKPTECEMDFRKDRSSRVRKERNRRGVTRDETTRSDKEKIQYTRTNGGQEESGCRDSSKKTRTLSRQKKTEKH